MIWGSKNARSSSILNCHGNILIIVACWRCTYFLPQPKRSWDFSIKSQTNPSLTTVTRTPKATLLRKVCLRERTVSRKGSICSVSKERALLVSLDYIYIYTIYKTNKFSSTYVHIQSNI